ncbi:GntR family transcriptional regulator [Kitasatospora xanthocidica]|uniref:GntR family transcriptional regulator n=1 Tax=Kitasatospora xanthocidica TaxID=83382 RepID=UPI0036EA8C02
MSIDPMDPRSPSQQIADSIRADITSGVLPPGAQVPSESELVARFGTSAQTVRKAIAALKAEGLVEGQRGRGVYVRKRAPMIRVGSDRYARHLRDSGKAPFQAEVEALGLDWKQEILELAEVPSPAWVAEQFGIAPGTTVFVRRRRTWIEDAPGKLAPTQLADSYYELDTVADTLIRQEDTGPGGGHARLEEKGFRITGIREELESRMPTPAEVHALMLRPGVPVVHLKRYVYSGDRTVEAFEAVLAGDRHTFAYQFAAPE